MRTIYESITLLYNLKNYHYQCVFCINSKYPQLYRETGEKEQGFKRLRVRDPDAVMHELLWAKAHFSLTSFVTTDDYVMGLKTDEIRYFAAEYKKHLGRPLVTGNNLVNLAEEKLRILCDAGLSGLMIGLQTGSKSIRHLYDRKWGNNRKILDKARLVNAFVRPGGIRRVTYLLIVDNPWESPQDRTDTLELVASLPQPAPSACIP